MTYNEYWYGDPLMVRAFYKAEELRQENMDRQAWFNGLYFMSALNATVGNIGNKGTLNEYPKEPVSDTNRREKAQLNTERKKEQEAVWAKAWMTQFVEAGKNWGKKT